MNQELIDMARQAGFFIKDNEAYSPSVQEDHELTLFLEAFAALVAAAEREACAKVCEELPAPDIYSDTDKSMWEVTCMDCGDAIRARGETEQVSPDTPPQRTEPVAWLEPEWGEKICPEVGFEATITSDHPRDLCWIPLYPHPPQRTWVGLTDDEIDELHGSPMNLEHSGELKWVRMIEAKLKQKNGFAEEKNT